MVGKETPCFDSNGETIWLRLRRDVYYETFDEFTAGINDCLSRVETDYKEELETLMKPKFQDFKKEKLLTL